MTETSASQPNYLNVTKGLFSWIFTLDHKRIGLLYLYTVGSFFLVGVVLGVIMRLELFNPGGDIIEAQTYNQVFTLHGVIMVFLFIIPSIPAIFGNFFLPIMLGTDDVAFPRINLMSWWMKETSKICKCVYLIGNHDFLENNMDRLDALSPVIDTLNDKNIVYFKPSFEIYSQSFWDSRFT